MKLSIDWSSRVRPCWNAVLNCRGLAFASLAVAAALSLSFGQAAAAEPIRIGAFLAATGPASYLGDPEWKVLQQTVAQWNAQGGLLGRPVELVFYDDAGSADKARTFANRLLTEDKVDMVIGGTTTGTTMAAVPLVERFRRPLISLAGGIDIVDPVKEWVFKVPHTDRMAAQRILTHMRGRGFKKLALISETAGFGQSGRRETLAMAKATGIEVVADETFAPTDTDMTAQLTRIKSSSGADAVLCFGAGQGPAILTRNYRQLDIKLPLYQSHGVASNQFIELAEQAANGVLLPSPPILVASQLPDADVQKPVVVRFANEYQQRWQQPPSTYAAYAYDALLILADAVKRAGGTDPEKLRSAMEQTQGLVGTNGVFTMSPKDHNGIQFDSMRMLEIQNGHWTLAN
jgi:branched-chain amino acid transport system substrate-binding protein